MSPCQSQISILKVQLIGHLTNPYFIFKRCFFRRVFSVHFQALMTKIKVNYYSLLSTKRGNYVQSYNQEVSKWNRTIITNKGFHILIGDKILTSSSGGYKHLVDLKAGLQRYFRKHLIRKFRENSQGNLS